MWKKILTGVGLLGLPVLVLIVHITTSGASPGGNWFAIPIYAVFFFPPFWLVCLVGGLIGLGIGALIDGTPKMPTKPLQESDTDSMV